MDYQIIFLHRNSTCFRPPVPSTSANSFHPVTVNVNSPPVVLDSSLSSLTYRVLRSNHGTIRQAPNPPINSIRKTIEQSTFSFQSSVSFSLSSNKGTQTSDARHQTPDAPPAWTATARFFFAHFFLSTTATLEPPRHEIAGVNGAPRNLTTSRSNTPTRTRC